MFKTEHNNWITRSLFLESDYKTEFAVYTLQDEDREYKGKKYLSLKRLYLEMQDPTEYTFATAYLGGWQHWKKIQKNTILNTHVEEWREELTLKLQAMGVKSMIAEAQMGGRGQATAARWLAEKGYLDKPTRTSRAVGRPRVVEEAKDARDAKLIKTALENDLEKLQIHMSSN